MSSDSSLTEWARLLFGTLAQAGIEEVIVSPGSRSTPFAYAALTTRGLRCHSLWDERSAGFVALGQARVSGRPSVLLCTSGSAAAGYFPAVVEAAGSYTPLLVLTADRPFELQECGAAQCMDQVKLYGSFARHYFELGHPDATSGALDALQRLAAQAVESTLRPVPGPVHVNARARKPLEPVEPTSEAGRALRASVDRRLERGPTRVFATPEREPSTDALAELARVCRSQARGLIVCGPLPDATDRAALFELARVSGYPLCVEATSQLRFALPDAGTGVVLLGAVDALFASRLACAQHPDLVLVVGAPPTSSAFERWRANTEAAVAVIAPHGFLDPVSRARWLVQAEVGAFALALSRALKTEQPDAEFRARQARFVAAWQRADSTYFELVRDLLEDSAEGLLSEPAAVLQAITVLPSGAWLGLGNSLPIREVDAFVPPAPLGLRVWSQRGVNGIDGLVSGALGVASVARGPSLALIGDVSFLHDVGGLAAARELEHPFALVVLDNDGGRIFDDLPVASALSARPDLLRFWLTPHGCDLQHAARLFGVGYARAESPAELDSALKLALGRPGLTLVHARVASASARIARERLHREFALAIALAEELG